VRIPERLAERVRAAYGADGAEWVRTLPARVAEYAGRWSLTLGPAPLPGATLSYLLPATGADGAPLVLKLSPPTPWAAHEAVALGHWGGAGAVRLEAADPAGGALLMERAVPGTPLDRLCRRSDEEATRIAAAVIRQLQQAPPTGPADTLPPITDWTARLGALPAAGAPLALRTAVREADAIAADLLAGDGAWTVLHGDLHQGNVVAAERAPWLAVDPKGVLGPPEAEAAALLRNPRSWLLARADRDALTERRIRQLADETGFDAVRLRDWGYVLAVVAACWALEDGEDEDVPRWLACADGIRAARA